MRCSNIKINMEIPLHIGEPDGNGIFYTKEAVENAYSDIKGKPIIQYDSNGNAICIGMVTDGFISNGVAYIDGKLWYGGTNCIVNEKRTIDDVEVVEDFDISTFGITK